MDSEDRFLELIALVGEEGLDEAGWEELNARLASDPRALQLYREHMELHATLHLAYAGEGLREDMPQTAGRVQKLSAGRNLLPLLVAGLALALVVVVGWLISSRSQSHIVAELVASEGAAWESGLPTEVGSELTAGRMVLTRGIATLRFRSGVTLVLEAPAELSLRDSMEVWLEQGVAMVEVPEQAIGFRVKTPHGYAVDHGTAFAIHVSEDGERSDFHVVDGEISVHLPEDRDARRLHDNEAVSIRDDEIREILNGDEQDEAAVPEEKVLRIGTDGRSYSVIRANKEKWLRSDMLLMNRRPDKPHERHAFFAFDLDGIDFTRVLSARIRLNQVPSGIGYAVALPEISVIGVYGLTDVAKADWQPGVLWEDAPFAKDGIRLGGIEIPRSEQRASRVFAEPSLLEFLTARAGQGVTFVLERETGKVDAGVPPLIHAFASDLHAEATGPTLELVLKP